jgi:hypothetical protein
MITIDGKAARWAVDAGTVMVAKLDSNTVGT